MSEIKKTKKKKKLLDRENSSSILKHDIFVKGTTYDKSSKRDSQSESYDKTNQPIKIWVRKDDDDPIPFTILDIHISVHDLKILLYKEFGEDLELTKPNKLKLRVNGSILLPQNKVYQVLFDGATVDLYINTIADLDDIDTQGNGKNISFLLGCTKDD